MRLADVAPRLARARDQHEARIAAERKRQRKLAHERLRLERLIAHRELQLLRAGTTRSQWYVDVRARKLASAQRALARLEKTAEHLFP